VLAELPGSTEDHLVILILSHLRESQATISSLVRCRSATVGLVISCFRECPLQEAAALVDDLSVSRVVRTVIASYPLKGETLVKAGGIIGEDIMRHFRSDYAMVKTPPDQVQEHWERLTMVAEGLKISLEFPTRFRLGMEESVTGRDRVVGGGWTLREDGEVTFHAENESLFPELLSHLGCEFDSFVDDFQGFKQLAPSLVEGPDDNGDKASQHPTAQSLRTCLGIVIKRGTYLGTCEFCSRWR